MADRQYSAFQAFVAPARVKAEIWRLVLGLVLVLVISLTLNLVLRVLLAAFLPEIWRSDLSAEIGTGTTPVSLMILLAAFGCLTIGVIAAVRFLHQRSPWTLLGDLPLAARQFWTVLRAIVLLGLALVVLPPYGSSSTPVTPNLAPGLWLLLLPFSLLALFIQISAEEVLFRGYMQQQLGARFQSPLVWMVLPSALFALGHYAPAEMGENALLFAIWSGLFGVFAADLTARSGTLGPALALHLANNASAILVISLPDSMSGLSLYTTAQSLDDPEALRALLPIELGVMLVAWLAARVALGR